MDEELSQCHVLVVEDDVAIQQLLIGHFLNEMGISDIAYADNGMDGLTKAMQRAPDLIILDIEMPKMNGLEMLRRLRSYEWLAMIPVIVQSGNDSEAQREQIFLAGASDFVTKPLNSNEFQARTRVHLQNLLRLRRVTDNLARIAHELQDAAQLQRALLPTNSHLAGIERNFGVGIDYLFIPSSQLGGDFWGLVPIDERHIGVYICDFAGHGVSAAMNTFQLHMLLDRIDPALRLDPAVFVAAISRALFGSLRLRQYATFLYAVINLDADVIDFCACASPNPLLGNRGKAEIAAYDGSGMPLGMLPEIQCENRQMAFPVGAYLFLYSDAITEAVKADGQMTGSAAVTGFTQFAARHPYQAGSLKQDFHSHWSADTVVADDLTALWIERLR